ncbi:MAG: RNase adapter RapZ [Gammaproteobacteria bacterium]|nr:RNase adapter RapZ [Gammaproteobacteria bacterium]
MRLTIISGQSGSGKSVALATLEDEGFYCIDNLPSALLPDLIEKVIESPQTPTDRIAIGIDARSDGDSIARFPELVTELRNRPTLEVEVVFLETNRNTLIKRFSETRRKHPLTAASTPLDIAIERETEVLTTIRSEADLIIDTSALNLHQLREVIGHQVVKTDSDGPAMLFQSFGFKHGAPQNTDFVFDVRCLPNPHWEPTLRVRTGQEQPVIEFLEQHATVEKMFVDIRDFLQEWLPLFRQENRAYLTISIGCTGGRHRSVYLSEKLANCFQETRGNVSVKHRELG